MALNWHPEMIPLYDFGETGAVDSVSATVTFYGSQCEARRELVSAKFFGETAITGDTSTKYDIGVWSGTTRLANLAFDTSTDHTANTYTDLTLNSTRTSRICAADTNVTVGCLKTGSPSNLHTNSKLALTWAPSSIY